MTSWLGGLPHDLKVLFDAKDDENLSQDLRLMVTGALIYIVSPRDAIADRSNENFASYTDDCLILRLALRKLQEQDDEDSKFFVSRFPEIFENLSGELTVCREVMGELYSWLESKFAALDAQMYKGKNVSQYLTDDELSEMLYEDGLAFRTEYPVDEDTLGDRLKKASTVLDVMARAKADEDRTR